MKKSLTLTLILLLSACASVAPGEDPAVLRAEQVIESALSTMDHYITWSDANRRVLGLDAARVAQHIKDRGTDYVDSSLNALQAYKEGSGNQAQLNKALALLNQLTIEALKHMPEEEINRGGFR